jgi:hypothetical protein
MKKKLLFVMSMICCTAVAMAQQVYDDFEASAGKVTYWDKSGTMLAPMANPKPGIENSSANCAKYIRNHSLQYDFMKMLPDSDIDIRAYVGASASKRMTMKLLTSAPANTMIEIQLGKKGVPLDTSFATTTHSLYRAYTSMQNDWEELTFYFVDYVDSTISPTEIDKLVMLISPNDTMYSDSVKYMRDTVYFDDFMGPEFTQVLSVNEAPSAKPSVLRQNAPNPATGITAISYALTEAGDVSLEIYNLLGEKVKVLEEKYLHPGSYTSRADISDLNPGVYFYALRHNGITETRKMIVGSRQ